MTAYPHPGRFDILLVEDEAADARLVEESLRDGKMLSRVHHVLDGEEALAYLRRQGERYAAAVRPDLILLDLNLPRLDGRDLLRLLRDDPEFRTIPVVVLTTSDVQRDVETAYGLGANSFITKPVDIDQFFHAIAGIQDYWFGLVRLPNGGL